MRANYGKTNKNIYEGKKFRAINKKEHYLIVEAEKHFLDIIEGKDLSLIPKETYIYIMMAKLCDNYPAETAEKGFYQVVDYEGEPHYLLHPKAMLALQDVVERVYAEYAVYGKDLMGDVIARWRKTLNFIETTII
jgi:hypothetical protein